jgi:HEPN domain-containing protein
MNDAPELVEKLRQWVEKAEEDYLVATRLLREPEDVFSSICFHAQQCVEKYLKALLTLRGIQFPKTHSLRFLLEILPDDADPGGTPAEIVPLSRYSADLRYPADAERVTRSEAEKAVAVASRARDRIRAQLPSAVFVDA